MLKFFSKPARDNAPSQPARRRSLAARRLSFEGLEARQLLAVDIAFDGGRILSSPNLKPTAVQVGNFNGDAFDDFAVANYEGSNRPKTVGVWLGNGNGTFQSSYVFDIGQQVLDLKLGDYNGDGRTDVFLLYSVQLTVNTSAMRLRILPGVGNGTLSTSLPELDLAQSFSYMDVGDINRDGRSDLLLTGNAGVAVRLSIGDGSFSSGLDDGTSFVRSGPVIADINGDARPDILFSRLDDLGQTSLNIRLQNTNGSWQAMKTLNLPDYYQSSLVVADFNEDGRKDLAISMRGPTVNNTTRVQIALGDGNGNFTLGNSYVLSSNDSGQLSLSDFNLDFHQDLLVSSSSLTGSVPTSFYALTGVGDGSFDPPTFGTVATDATRDLLKGDFNEDGVTDILTLNLRSVFVTTFFNLATKKNSIRGRVWSDTNRNGNFDSGEPPLNARTVWADQNDNNIVDATEWKTQTRSDGTFELLVPDGTHNIRQLLPNGWVQTVPTSLPGQKPYAYSVIVAGQQIRSGWNFPSFNMGTISGYIYNDTNASNTFDNYESGLGGRFVFIDLNNDGTFNGAEPSSVTTSDGLYRFFVQPGNYTVRAVTESGWLATASSTMVVSLGVNQVLSNQNFGTTRPGGVSGTIYYDTAAKGYKADSDAGIANVRVYLDANLSGTFDPGEPSAFSDAQGNYAIANQYPGRRSVRIVKPSGRLFTDPIPDANGVAFYDTFIYGGSAGGNTNFGLIYPAYATGRVFNDKNASGVADAGEAGLANIYLFVDYNSNGLGDLGEPSAITDANGNYKLTSSLGGALSIAAIKPSGMTATVPSSGARTVNFVQGQTVSNQNFGFVQGPFSNAPYQSPINITTGSNPVALASGDFNRDGKADFLVANNSFPGQIFLGQGTGLFTEGVEFSMGSATRFMVVADLNNDSFQDLVAANQDDNGVGVLLGAGDGTFAAAVPYAAALGTYSVSVADFNNDGKLDLATVGVADSRIGILLGNGNGTLATAQFITTEFGAGSIATGDINRDGFIDLMVASSSDSSLTYHPGLGNGSFGPRVRTSLGVVQPAFVTLADFNGDQKLDVAFVNEFSDQAVVRVGDGAGGFGSPVFLATTAGPKQIAVIDVDRDGKLDMIVSCRSDGTTDISGGVSIFRGNGDGTFQPHMVSTAHTSPTSVAVADFNRDGKLDIVAANFFSSDVSLLINGTAGPLGSISGVVWRDSDVDGVRDAGELGLGNQTVFNDVNGDFLLTAGERFTLTASNGAFVLSGLGPGTYRLRTLSSSDYVPTSPLNRLPVTVTLVSGQNVGSRSLGMAATVADGGIVIDNVSTKLTGVWTNQTTPVGYYGGGYLTDGNALKGSKAARFDATLPFDGYYRVSLRWVAGSDRSNNVPIDIVASTGTRTTIVNQQNDGGVWNDMGVYYFTRAGGAVAIRNAGTTGLVIADAVRFVAVASPPALVKDNSDATGVTLTGAWSPSTSTSGFYGTNYLSDGNPAVKGNHAVTFSPGSLGTSGVFEVFARWTAGSNRASNASYDVLTASGIKTVTVDQRTRGGQWVSLGFFDLNALGTTIKLRNDGANGFVIADAVRVVRVK